MRVPRPLVRLALPLLLVLVPSLSTLHASGWPHDPGQGLPIAVAPRGQCVQGIVSDTHGGVDIVYCEPCSSYTFPVPPLPALQVHAVHLFKRGDVDPAWPPVTRTLPPFSGFFSTVLADGLGGFFLAWMDARSFAVSGYDIAAHHVRADGSLDPAWPANGRVLCSAPGRQSSTSICTDGAGGLIAEWSDRRDSAATQTDLYAMRVRANGTLDPAWPTNGLPVYVGALNQVANAIVPDGAGGAIAVWTDNRNNATTGPDIYAQHLLGGGTIDPAWPVGGRDLSAVVGSEQIAQALTDDAGGAFVWWDADGADRITHIRADGTLDPGWPAGGLALDPSADAITGIQAIDDGHGGALVVCQASYSVGPIANRVLVRHVFGNGSYDPAWPSGGVRLGSATSNYGVFPYSAVSDGSDGVIVSFLDDLDGTGTHFEYRLLRVRSDGMIDDGWIPTGRTWAAAPSRPQGVYETPNGDGSITLAWSDLRDSAATYLDAYAQRITKDGLPGLIEPAIHAVRDVPNDQGGKLTVYWYASAYDTLPADPITEYDVWRQLQGPAAQRALANGARLSKTGVAPRAGDIRAARDGAQDVFWEFVGGAPSRGMIDYALTVPTRADSTALDPARATYEVDAHGTSLNYIITSDPDSGYSVDNLPPLAPAPFTDTYDVSTGSSLAWGNNVESDLAGYRLYRGSAWGFVPSPGNRIYDGNTTNFHDNGGPAYYKLSAYDRHGNEGPYAIVHGGTVSAPDARLPRELAMTLASANPARGGVNVTLALPRPAWVRLAVFDAAGRRARMLLDAAREPGDLALHWDGRDDSGADAAAGLYFIRMQAEGRTLVKRVAMLR